MLEYEAERVELEKMQISVDRCLRAILESESYDLLKKLRARASTEEKNMPFSVGYELISLDGNEVHEHDAWMKKGVQEDSGPRTGFDIEKELIIDSTFESCDASSSPSVDSERARTPRWVRSPTER